MRKLNFLYCAPALLIALVLNGCVSLSESPTPRFYIPDSVVKAQPVEKFKINSGTIIAVGPIKIPEYQDRPQMVTKNKDGTFKFAQFDRWGEPLDSVLARLFSENLAVMLPAASFQSFPCNFAIPLDYQVIVDIIQLDSELEKDMVVIAQWSIIDARNRKMLLTKRSYLAKAINPHNYSGLSQALGEACASLSREIAENLSNLSKQPGAIEPAAK